MTASQIQPAHNIQLAHAFDFTREQIDLIKNTVAVGCTDLELQLFLEVCRSTGLNPMLKQAYAIKRKVGREEKMVIQTGIDGYRLIASRTGIHLGTTDPEFGPKNADGYPDWARVIVRRLVHGHIAEFPATARWSEYVQTKNEWKNGQSTGNKTVSDMWARMPHTMLGKCAESLALRKAFPAELSGVFTNEEMAQADNVHPVPAAVQEAKPVVQETKPAPAPQSAPDPKEAALQAWAIKIGEMAERVRNLGAPENVSAIEKAHAWRTDLDAARLCYDQLKALGMELHNGKAQPTEPTPMPAEAMLTPEQRGQLQAVAKASDAASSEQRYALWAYMINSPTPIATNNLTAEQAAYLLDTFSAMNPDERAQCLTEACAKFKVAAE
ncbi:phage recombination protein Bet [Deinococcus sp. QL22]|uniref:phage recombination protein Bet n=1 Tax=Deinococcus sp. QL22 TaxID=2939437 RepID=UPI0020172050|nr:phage recombination protein Bet [Deinococcus sp. QL22]UQN06322.1 phage recombination protein Bet [Deinococcus sp. QL22]